MLLHTRLLFQNLTYSSYEQKPVGKEGTEELKSIAIAFETNPVSLRFWNQAGIRKQFYHFQVQKSEYL